jgi:plasmid stability protein
MEERWRNGMATLNVKSLPDALYRRLRKRAAKERRSVAQQVIHILERALDEPAPISILELKGLGKELWRERDAATHVEEERRSWD